MKTFERVAGARLTGSIDASNGTVVTASIQLHSTTGRNFTSATQTTVDPDGTFSITVPYASTGNVPPAADGTDSGIEAMRDYRVVLGNPFQPSFGGTVAEAQSAVYDGSTVPVELTRVTGANQSGVNASALTGPDALKAPA